MTYVNRLRQLVDRQVEGLNIAVGQPRGLWRSDAWLPVMSTPTSPFSASTSTEPSGLSSSKPISRKSPKVLMRMFSATGNPQAKNFFEIVAYLQKIDGTILEVVERAAA